MVVIEFTFSVPPSESSLQCGPVGILLDCYLLGNGSCLLGRLAPLLDLLASLPSPSGLQNRSGPWEFTRATAFDLWRVDMVVLELVHPYFLPCPVAAGFLSAAGCWPGPDWYGCPTPLLFLQGSLFCSWLQLFQWWGTCFLCSTSLQIQGPACSPLHPPHLVSHAECELKVSPQILPDDGGQIQSDSLNSDSQMHEMFWSPDCQNFSFLIPICSDNIFFFLWFLKKKKKKK